MKTLIDLKDKIINFWDLEEPERDQLIDEIKAYAAQADLPAFAAEVRNNFPFKEFSGIGVIYEALSEHQDKWIVFFKEEIERAFKAAERADNPFEILDCLEEISFIDESNTSIRGEVIDFISTYLSHPKDPIRYKSIWLIGDWIGEDNAGQYPHIIQRIKEKLKDPNWKIRTITKGVLEDMGKLPAGYKIPLMDKMRAKVSSPYEMS